MKALFWIGMVVLILGIVSLVVPSVAPFALRGVRYVAKSEGEQL